MKKKRRKKNWNIQNSIKFDERDNNLLIDTSHGWKWYFDILNINWKETRDYRFNNQKWVFMLMKTFTESRRVKKEEENARNSFDLRMKKMWWNKRESCHETEYEMTTMRNKTKFMQTQTSLNNFPTILSVQNTGNHSKQF